MAFTIKQSDTSPAIQATLQDSNAVPINLSGATIKLHMKLLGSDTVLEKDMTIVTPLSGIIRYDWQVGDTSVVGTYNAEFEVTYADLTVETFPNTGNIPIVIIPELN
jgi:hypothetical protein